MGEEGKEKNSNCPISTVTTGRAIIITSSTRKLINYP
jgi:hypothetical protein